MSVNELYEQHCTVRAPDKWDRYYCKLSELTAEQSKDPHTQVGCVVHGPDREIRSTGYNSFPRGINDYRKERLQRPEKYFWIEHAERNAIYNAVLSGTSLKGCTIYCQWVPCMDCARGIVQCGIKQVVIDRKHQDHWESSPKWQEQAERTLVLFSEAGVKLDIVDTREDCDVDAAE